ncbi:MAG: hypothetical protein PHD61_10365 [Bacteroidales bacterium]|nr:hypothetical protein [Lentimicrobiaceae bacterium]MDD5695689.1 hypothetical protein [Bacteroidales bacterium]
MKKSTIPFKACLLPLLAMGCAWPGLTQTSNPFLFGNVTTKDNITYSGPIRWGNEEVLWTDIFNSTKTGNDYLQHLRQINNKVLIIENEDQRELMSIEVDDAFSQIHTFECQFGDILSLDIISSARVDMRLKNNFVYHLRNGSNDVGAEIQILDKSSGHINLPWDKIRKVEFMDAPADLQDGFGNPLYGTVYTTQGEFSGQIEWDQDERLTTDILNGDTENEELGIPFGTIRSIIRQGNGSQVIMVNGDEFYLTGSNDVNSENRGIIVTIKGLGRIEVPWEAFNKIIFDKDVVGEGPGYRDFPVAESLKGIVYSKSEQVLSGGIVFDMDEAFDTEFLQGKSEKIEYQIPFRNIVSIVPTDARSSEISLRNGEKLSLSNMQDVSFSNNGMLILEDTSSIIQIDWKEVMEVRFR